MDAAGDYYGILYQLKNGCNWAELPKDLPPYSTVYLVDLDRRVPMGFVASRKQENIKKVLEGRGTAVLNQIVEVSIDFSLD